MIQEDKTLKLVALGLGTVSLVALLRGLHRREIQLAARRQAAKDGLLNGTPQTAPDKGLGEIDHGHWVVGNLPKTVLGRTQYSPGKIVLNHRALKHMEKHEVEIAKYGKTVRQFAESVCANYDCVRKGSDKDPDTGRRIDSLLLSETSTKNMLVAVQPNEVIDDKGKACWLALSAQPRTKISESVNYVIWSGDPRVHRLTPGSVVKAPTTNTMPDRRMASYQNAVSRRRQAQLEAKETKKAESEKHTPRVNGKHYHK